MVRLLTDGRGGPIVGGLKAIIDLIHADDAMDFLLAIRDHANLADIELDCGGLQNGVSTIAVSWLNERPLTNHSHFLMTQPPCPHAVSPRDVTV